MKQEISALMDGEMFEDQADALLDKLKRHPEVQQEWGNYHLIGDALRQPDHICKNFGKSFHERLKAEPTVIAPYSRTTQRVRNFALSAVASVMALALVAWLSLQVGSEPAPQVAMIPQDNISAIRPASAQVDDYLMAHQEYSPSADIHGAASYIRAVAGR
ncbi:sigma-E factor negative regulatory protein [Sideroxydans lithotrophicus]|uniref:Anti sigma-E protein, RseA n=1 Tax=Sideroxydans lithotrophicus (strain ES-1) TaxID=580332 RepID=D5CRC6_SIDLE|nr:sigma-E factor negative regulatory protein [Sideroxydans lithotrophicus]ADE11512.1 anti sigma-E protein, RseA [Sideroxydans lithotrophicus ES-1]